MSSVDVGTAQACYEVNDNAVRVVVVIPAGRQIWITHSGASGAPALPAPTPPTPPAPAPAVAPAGTKTLIELTRGDLASLSEGEELLLIVRGAPYVVRLAGAGS